MTNTHELFQEVFDELYTLSIRNKIVFLEVLLFHFSITGRALWSDNNVTDKDKVVALKWLNELCHRIWNIIFELQIGEDKESITRLYENLKFYGQQSDLLRVHLVPTILEAFENFKAKKVKL